MAQAGAKKGKLKACEINRLKSLKNKEETLRLVKEGFSSKKIAEVLGLHPDTIARYRKEAGVVTEAHQEAAKRRTAELVKRVVELDGSGLTNRQIGELFGMGPDRVCFLRRQGGVSKGRKFSTQEDRDKAMLLLEDGVSYFQVGKTLGWEPSTIAKWHPGYKKSPSEVAELAALGRKFRRLSRRLQHLEPVDLSRLDMRRRTSVRTVDEVSGR